jgi:hypothetical protein
MPDGTGRIIGGRTIADMYKDEGVPIPSHFVKYVRPQ